MLTLIYTMQYIDFPYRYSSLIYNNPEVDIVNILTTEYHMTQSLLGLETWGRSLLLFQHTTATSASAATASPSSSSIPYTTTTGPDLKEPNHTPSLLLPLTSSDSAHSHVEDELAAESIMVGAVESRDKECNEGNGQAMKRTKLS